MTTVLVLGTHRSGTSLVAGMLNELGVAMGPPGEDRSWICPNWANPTGQYENPEFSDLLHQLLDFDGEEPVWDRRWDDPAWLGERTARFRPAFEELIRRTSRGRPFWGWKQVWTMLILPELLGLVEDPRFVVVRRPSEEVVDSLLRRDGLTLAQARETTAGILTRVDGILGQFGAVPRIEITYQEAMANGPGTVDRLGQFLRVPSTEEQRRRANALSMGRAELRIAIRRFAVQDFLTLPSRTLWVLSKDVRERSRFAASHLLRSKPRETYRILRAMV